MPGSSASPPTWPTAVCIGFDEPRPLGEGEAGGLVAAPVFSAFMREALADRPALPFRTPPGLRMVRVNAETGDPLAQAGDRSVIMEAFKPGTAPVAARDQAPAAGGQGQSAGTGGLY